MTSITMKIRFLLALSCVSFFTAQALAQADILDARLNYNIGDDVTVVGVVTNDGDLGSVRYIQDETAAIAIYPGGDWTSWDVTPGLGDSLSVTGTVTEYNGLLEVGPDLTDVTLLGVGTLPEPMLITPNQMGENLEGQTRSHQWCDLSSRRDICVRKQHL